MPAAGDEGSECALRDCMCVNYREEKLIEYLLRSESHGSQSAGGEHVSYALESKSVVKHWRAEMKMHLARQSVASMCIIQL